MRTMRATDQGSHTGAPLEELVDRFLKEKIEISRMGAQRMALYRANLIGLPAPIQVEGHEGFGATIAGRA